ncbi:MAG: hypothetical protein B7Z38_05445 [Rhodobacterales bacterium 12-64-8]|nr:MAG: hypothetical protein B7Z38_05445 [Rhodobacterales bacterium 12-64-8]OYX45827.1 MAG: hypothetical protein B7Y90_18035 [Alphaproteobacteria bacterium 32-64-14]
MIAIKRLALATVTGCVAIAASAMFGLTASADTNRTEFTIAFAYDAGESAEHNYGAFVREARRACTTPGKLSLNARQHDIACIDDAVDAFVRKLGRTEIAAVHFDRTGRRIDSSRTLAAR